MFDIGGRENGRGGKGRGLQGMRVALTSYLQQDMRSISSFCGHLNNKQFEFVYWLGRFEK